MKRSEIEEMDRLRAAVDRLHGELQAAKQNIEYLEHQVARKEGAIEALQDLLTKQNQASPPRASFKTGTNKTGPT